MVVIRQARRFSGHTREKEVGNRDLRVQGHLPTTRVAKKGSKYARETGGGEGSSPIEIRVLNNKVGAGG